MSRATSYFCDCCGAVKKEANHWFVLERDPEGGEMQILRWEDRVAEETDGVIACGEKCVHIFVARWIQFGNFAGVDEKNLTAESAEEKRTEDAEETAGVTRELMQLVERVVGPIERPVTGDSDAL